MDNKTNKPSYDELMRQFNAASITIENLEAQVKQLATELSAVESIHNEAVFITDEDYEQCPKRVQDIIRHLAVMQIPAYDAFLSRLRNEHRAEGVEMFSAELADRAKSTSPSSGEILKAAGRGGLAFARQLREGKAGEVCSD